MGFSIPYDSLLFQASYFWSQKGTGFKTKSYDSLSSTIAVAMAAVDII